jgi:formate-dependent nitrite reductase membrane component NrfD
MKIGKFLLAGIFAGIAIFVVGNLAYQMNQAAYSDPAMMHLWKPMAMPGWLVVLLVVNIFTGLLYAASYAMVGKALGGGVLNKGLFFGLIAWGVGNLPGMLMTYITMAVSDKLIKVWTIEGLISSLVAGVVIAAIYRE